MIDDLVNGVERLTEGIVAAKIEGNRHGGELAFMGD